MRASGRNESIVKLLTDRMSSSIAPCHMHVGNLSRIKRQGVCGRHKLVAPRLWFLTIAGRGIVTENDPWDAVRSECNQTHQMARLSSRAYAGVSPWGTGHIAYLSCQCLHLLAPSASHLHSKVLKNINKSSLKALAIEGSIWTWPAMAARFGSAWVGVSS
jgi:hypothetical protein